MQMVAVALRAVKSAPSSFAPPLELALTLASASKLESSVRLAL
jgi:hypothetical protein